MEFTAPFGTWLKQRRSELGMTRNDLARCIGYSPETLHKIEGDALKASVSVADRLIEPLKVPDHQREAFIAFATGGALRRPHNLPAPATSLLGREHELAVARKWLHNGDSRLITFVGPPGVGKTRLALQVAWNVLDHFNDGAWLVALAAETDAASVAISIAGRLGVPLSASEDAQEAVTQHLRDRHLLLLLDNFEQVLSAGLMIAELLAAAPKLHVLATSRVALNLTGEHLFEVAPLDEQPAIELFVERAQAINPAYKLNHNVGVVAEICARLDYLPLAIELAASRIRLFSAQQLLSRLDSRLTLLTSSARDIPPRHRKLRDAIEVSYLLLSEAEQTLLRRLGVFAGGFTLDAADQVAGVDVQQPMIDLLQTLIDHSLVKADTQDNEPRYAMLQTILEYAREALKTSGEADVVARRHAEYFAGMAERRGAQWLQDVEHFSLEIPNLRLALATARRLDDTILQLRLLAILPRNGVVLYQTDDPAWPASLFDACDPEAPAMRTLYGRALLGAGRIISRQSHDRKLQLQMLQRSVRLLEEAGDTNLLVDALDEMSGLAWCMGDFALTADCAERIMNMRQAMSDPYALALSKNHLAGAWRDFGRHDVAATMFEECIQLSRDIGSAFVEGLAQNGMADLEFDRGRFEPSHARCHLALAAWRNESSWYRALPLRGLGRLACVQGNFSEAEVYLAELRSVADEDDSPEERSYVLHHFAWLKHLQGDDACAERELVRAIQSQLKATSRLNLLESVERAAWIAADQHKPAYAAQLFGACAAQRKAMGTPQAAGDHDPHARALSDVCATLTVEAFNEAWTKGEAMSLDEAAAFALASLSKAMPEVAQQKSAT